MSQHRKTVLLWVLLLAICTALMSGCIHPDEGDFYITATDETSSSPDDATSKGPEESNIEESIPKETTPQVFPPEGTSPEVTTPEETTTEQMQETTTPAEKIKIYLDAGHNPMPDPPEDPEQEPIKMWNTGAQGNGLDEADLTFEIAMLLYEMLMQDDRFEVRLSRSTAETILGTDNGSALDFRVNDATEWDADYFISLHINAFTSSSVSGLEVYSASGDQVGYDLGKDILDGLVQSVELNNRGMKNGDNLRVLKNATMPAVLVEMGFISNENDAALLDNSPDLFAKGVYNGILNYFNSLE